MNVFQKIHAWLRYIAAILNWVADVVVLKSFPKKTDYFGARPINNQEADSGRPVTADSGNVGGSSAP